MFFKNNLTSVAVESAASSQKQNLYTDIPYQEIV